MQEKAARGCLVCTYRYRIAGAMLCMCATMYVCVYMCSMEPYMERAMTIKALRTLRLRFDVGLKRTKNREFGLRHHHFCPKFRTFITRSKALRGAMYMIYMLWYVRDATCESIRVRAMILATLDVFRRCVRNFGLCTRFVRLILTSNQCILYACVYMHVHIIYVDIYVCM